MTNNTVYILGAGFSYPAKVPLQSELLREILNYETEPYKFEIVVAQDKLKEFISTFFKFSNNVTLEDIFTILDKSIIGKERFKHYIWLEMYILREQLIYLILYIIGEKSLKETREIKSIYKDFSKIVRDEEIVGNGNSSLNSIISLNWDTILEQYLNEFYKENIVINYGTFIHTLKYNDETKTTKKLMRKFNVKILKLHGSLNWLFCDNCGRLFVNMQTTINIERQECEFCREEKLDKKIPLSHLILTPTFLKELANLHLKNIWQNAFIELQKASKVIFIGYSLPYADFELKYLFKKAIKPTSEIEVVLIKNDKTNGTKDRYESFFGKDINFDFRGLKGWLKKNMQ